MFKKEYDNEVSDMKTSPFELVKHHKNFLQPKFRNDNRIRCFDICKPTNSTKQYLAIGARQVFIFDLENFELEKTYEIFFSDRYEDYIFHMVFLGRINKLIFPCPCFCSIDFSTMDFKLKKPMTETTFDCRQVWTMAGCCTTTFMKLDESKICYIGTGYGQNVMIFDFEKNETVQNFTIPKGDIRSYFYFRPENELFIGCYEYIYQKQLDNDSSNELVLELKQDKHYTERYAYSVLVFHREGSKYLMYGNLKGKIVVLEFNKDNSLPLLEEKNFRSKIARKEFCTAGTSQYIENDGIIHFSLVKNCLIYSSKKCGHLYTYDLISKKRTKIRDLDEDTFDLDKRASSKDAIIDFKWIDEKTKKGLISVTDTRISIWRSSIWNGNEELAIQDLEERVLFLLLGCFENNEENEEIVVSDVFPKELLFCVKLLGLGEMFNFYKSFFCL